MMNQEQLSQLRTPRSVGAAPLLEILVDSRPYVEALMQLLLRQREGYGCLPYYLGLDPLELMAILQIYECDPELVVTLLDQDAADQQPAWERGRLRQELLDLRRDEWDDIRGLLLKHRANRHSLEECFASAIAAGCLGGDHLWRDLGMPTRAHLGDLIALNFPTLAARNVNDMKWKKFFYKQLCEAEGGYVCRAPTCEQCAAYSDCFGPEI